MSIGFVLGVLEKPIEARQQIHHLVEAKEGTAVLGWDGPHERKSKGLHVHPSPKPCDTLTL